MPVYVISIRPADALTAQIKTLLGETPTVLGVDGRQMSASEYFTHNIEALRLRKRTLSPGETGCALSHLEAYRRLGESRATGALVFEEDVILPPTLAQLDVCAFEGHFDVVLLGCMQGLPGQKRLRGRRVADARHGLPPLYAVPQRYTRYALRCAAYWISRDAALRLREHQLGFLRKADDWRDWGRQLGLRMGFMDLCAHPLDLSGSLLEAERQALSRRRAPPRDKRWRMRFFSDWLVAQLQGLELCCSEARDAPASQPGVSGASATLGA